MKNSKQVFIEHLHMETQTVFHANGDININPCGFELGQHILAGGRESVCQRGSLQTDDDGTSRFRAYKSDKSRVLELLFKTRHGDLKCTKHSIIARLAFPKELAPEDIAKGLECEIREMVKCIMARRKK